MRTTKRLAVLLALLALVAAGCSSGSYAATVDDASIVSESVYPLAGLDPEDGTVSGDDFRGSLTLLIIQSALAQTAAEEFGLPDPTTDEARRAYLDNAPQDELAAIERAVNAGVEQGRERQASADYIVTQQIIRTTVRDAILHDDDFLHTVYDESPELLISMCLRHILVATEEEVDDVYTRLASGEDFSAVADDVSLDQQSAGGVLPCPSSPYMFSETFGVGVSVLDVGLAPEPVQTQFGFHVIQVDSKDQPGSFEELAADPGRYVPQQMVDGEYSLWLDAAVDTASITVRSNIGTWFPNADGIIPPEPGP